MRAPVRRSANGAGRRFAPPAAIALLAILATPAVPAAAGTPARARSDPPTRSVPLARAREAILRSSPRGSRPTIGPCRRGREWTTCDVYERRVLREEDGASYPITLDFTECVGERGHEIIINTREVTMIVPASA